MCPVPDYRYFFHVVRAGFNPSLQPMLFYLEFVWLMGGITLLVLYLYGTLLSENVFGGIYGVISYLMFHSFAAKIYERPMARENFAFPFIFLQMFYLCICIGRILHRQKHTSRLCMVGECACNGFAYLPLSHSILILFRYS